MTLYRGSGSPTVGTGVGGYEEHTATAGQTVFNLSTVTYSIGSYDLHVYIGGVRQSHSAYTETSATSVTFSEGLNAGDKVLFDQVS